MTDKPIKATLDSSDDSVKTQKPILIQLDDIPTPEAGDAGKALVVNDEETGYTLASGGGDGGGVDLEIRCNARSFSETVSDYEIVTGSIDSVFSKILSGKPANIKCYSIFNGSDEHYFILANCYLAIDVFSMPTTLFSYISGDIIYKLQIDWSDGNIDNVSTLAITGE